MLPSPPNAPAPDGAGAPVAGAERLVVLDVLRGVALFGILVVNMGAFRGAAHPVVDEARFPGTTARLAEGVVTWLAQGKFFPLFSFLFGYGLIVQRARAGAGGRWGPRIARRLIGLGVLGVLHGVLAFSGDILLTYALAGAVLVALALADDRTVRITAVVLVATSAVVTAATAAGLNALAWADGGAEGIAGDAAVTAGRYRSGSFLTVTGQRAVELAIATVAQFPLGAFTTVLGVMAAGLLAGRAGLFSRPGRYRRPLERARAWGLAVGLVGGLVFAVVTGLLGGREPTASITTAVFAATAVGTLTAPFLTAGLVASVALVRHRGRGRLLRALAPAGRMALTNYLAQSAVCSLLFSGYGLGWYGRVGPLAGLALATAVFAAQGLASHLWLRTFAVGPVEWLLRWFTYGRRPSFRSRTTRVAA